MRRKDWIIYSLCTKVTSSWTKKNPHRPKNSSTSHYTSFKYTHTHQGMNVSMHYLFIYYSTTQPGASLSAHCHLVVMSWKHWDFWSPMKINLHCPLSRSNFTSPSDLQIWAFSMWCMWCMCSVCKLSRALSAAHPCLAIERFRFKN